MTDLVEVGRGGFGVVFRGRQEAIGREVAVKVLASDVADPAVVRRWQREVLALGRLSDHPHIVTVHAADVAPSGHPYMVMPFLPDGSLAESLASGGRWPADEVVEVGIGLADALAAAHARGVLHLDVKPANVMLSPHGAQLADFGIARLSDGSETASTNVTATIGYAAPEVLAGQEPGPGADVYGLGATLWALVAGHGPFESSGQHPASQLGRVLTTEPPDLRSRGVPAPLVDAIREAMEKDPTRRTRSAAELRIQLEQVRLRLGGCAGCGSELDLVSAFCTKCGEPVPIGHPSLGASRVQGPVTAALSVDSGSGPAVPVVAPVAGWETPRPAMRPPTGVGGGPGPGAGRLGWAVIVASIIATLLTAATAVLLIREEDSASGTSAGGGPTSAATNAPSEGTVVSEQGPAAPDGGSGGTPDSVAEVEVGRWILILVSRPKASTSLAAATAEAASLGGGDQRVVVLDSDVTPGLTPGYWAVVAASFDTRDEARARCPDFGREVGGDCYPRRVGDGAS